MALSAEDQRLVASMREREFNIKKRQRAANAVYHRSRLYRWALTGLTALLFATVATGIFVAVTSLAHLVNRWRLSGLVAAAGIIVGTALAQVFLRTRPGRRLLAGKDRRLNRKYSRDLQAGRLWMHFYYDNEDISPYVPQILHALESEGRFDSVREALEFVKRHHHENSQAQDLALRQFNDVAAEGNLVVVSSLNAGGRLSSRAMYYVKSERPGVWYVTTAPNSAKVAEFDAGNVAVLTVPTKDGATIRSNDLRIRRAGKALSDIVGLYRAQAPGYLAEMKEDDRQLEIVYELTLHSARIDSWTGHDLVSFGELDGTAQVPGQRPSTDQSVKRS